MVSVSIDGKTTTEPMRLQLTMENLILQKVDTSTPTASMGPPAESKVTYVVYNTHVCHLCMTLFMLCYFKQDGNALPRTKRHYNFYVHVRNMWNVRQSHSLFLFLCLFFISGCFAPHRNEWFKFDAAKMVVWVWALKVVLNIDFRFSYQK